MKQAKLLHQHRYILKKLANSSIKDRKIILKNAPKELFTTLNLIFKLLHSGKLTLPQKAEQNIKKHQKLIRSTSKLGVNSIKSKLSRQRGGSLPKILSTVLPIIAAIVKTII